MKFWYLFLVLLIKGLSLMAAQLMGAKLSALFFGSSFYVWTAVSVIPVWGLTMGYYSCGKFSSYYLKNVWEKLFINRGYFVTVTFRTIVRKMFYLITEIRSNTKNTLISFSDKIILGKRAVTELVIDELKSICQTEHSRYRGLKNFIANLISGLIAYSFLLKKLLIQLKVVKSDQVDLFKQIYIELTLINHITVLPIKIYFV